MPWCGGWKWELAPARESSVRDRGCVLGAPGPGRRGLSPDWLRHHTSDLTRREHQCQEGRDRTGKGKRGKGEGREREGKGEGGGEGRVRCFNT